MESTTRVKNCIKCLEPISAARIAAKPNEPRCTDCQEQIEFDRQAAAEIEQQKKAKHGDYSKRQAKKYGDIEDEDAEERIKRVRFTCDKLDRLNKARTQQVQETHEMMIRLMHRKYRGETVCRTELTDPTLQTIVDKYEKDDFAAAMFTYLSFRQYLSGKYGSIRPKRQGHILVSVRLSDHRDGEDILHDIYVSALRQIDNFRGRNEETGEVAEIDHWLNTMFTLNMQRGLSTQWKVNKKFEQWIEDGAKDSDGDVTHEDDIIDIRNRKLILPSGDSASTSDPVIMFAEPRMPLQERRVYEQAERHVMAQNERYKLIGTLLKAGYNQQWIANELCVSAQAINKHVLAMGRLFSERAQHLRTRDGEYLLWPVHAANNSKVGGILGQLKKVRPNIHAQIVAQVPLSKIAASMGWNIRSLKTYLKDYRLAIQDAIKEVA